MNTMNWVPIIPSSSDLGVRCWSTAGAIATSLLNDDHAGKRCLSYEEALLFGYLALAANDNRWAAAALERLNAAIAAAASMAGCRLFGGLCGLGWTVDHLSQLLSGTPVSEGDSTAFMEEDAEDEDEDINADIDSRLLRELQQGRWLGPYDLISGLVGFGVYFLERLPAEKATLGVELAIYHLYKASERNGKLVTWHTAPELLPAGQFMQFRNGYYNLGVAQGIPGILHFLSEALAAGVEPRKTSRLLEGGVEWLMAQERPSGLSSRFSEVVAPVESSESRMLAWCSGDLGIMAVMHQVADRCGREDWKRLAERLADDCLSRSQNVVPVGDASICHGFMGIAHIYNRVYQAYRDMRFHAAALQWYERALATWQASGEDFFTMETSQLRAHRIVEDAPFFLDGAIGVALALLGAVTPVNPAWDRLLLLSGRDWNEAQMNCGS
jgi:hypothetical protein